MAIGIVKNFNVKAWSAQAMCFTLRAAKFELTNE